jgi:hypothetical protein
VVQRLFKIKRLKSRLKHSKKFLKKERNNLKTLNNFKVRNLISKSLNVDLKQTNFINALVEDTLTTEEPI